MQTTTSNLLLELSSFRTFVKNIDSIPAELFDPEFHYRLQTIDLLSCKMQPGERQQLMAQFFADSSDEFEHGYMCRHSRLKPLGYAGDHMMIDMIYRRCTDEDGIGNRLDSFYHRQKAPTAVRNRKSYFVSLVDALSRQGGATSVLNIACGPCRDVAEALEVVNGHGAAHVFHCIDLDSQALQYARSVVPHYYHHTVQWQQANALRLKTNNRYELVWSAGLFDYLDDRKAALLLRKMWQWATAGGEVVVGNFHTSNSDRPWMEWCGNWHLIHRDEEDMMRICKMADIDSTQAQIEYEPLGINMFLRIKKL